jgi:outer membrane murein-binding lipoprotein Lpp
MKSIKKIASLIFAGVFALSLVAGCSSNPSEEEIKTMEEAKAAALSAEGTHQETQKTRQDLENQVRSKEAERDAAKREYEAVKKRLEEQNQQDDSQQ